MIPPTETQLGWLALLAGHIDEQTLEHCLQRQHALQAEGRGRPLGALLIETGLITESALSDLLAEQGHYRNSPDPMRVRLSARENRLFGQLLIANDLVDPRLLASCREQLKWDPDGGAERSMGELLIDRGLLDRPETKARLIASFRAPPPALPIWRTPVGDPPPIDPDLDRQFELARLVSTQQLGQLRALQTQLGELGLPTQLARLANDLGYTDRSQDEIEPPLTPEEERQLISQLLDGGLRARIDPGRLAGIQAAYGSHQKLVSIAEIVARLGLIDPAEIPAALKQQALQGQLTRLYFGGEARPVAGLLGRYQLSVEYSGASALVGESFRFDEGDTVLVGRSTSSSFRLADPSLSKLHARLSIRDGQLEVVDLGSSNGTLIAGKRVTQGRISNGEVFWLGGSQLRFLDIITSHPEGLSIEEPEEDGSQSLSASTMRRILRELEIASEPGAGGDPLDDTQVAPTLRRGGPPLTANGGETAEPPAAIAGTRMMFREFYSKDEQMKVLLDDQEPATPARVSRSGRVVQSAVEARGRWLPIAALVAAGLLLLTPLAVALLQGLRSRRDRPARPDQRRPPVQAAALPTPVPAPEVGEWLRLTGIIFEYREYRGATEVTGFDLLLKDDGGELQIVQGNFQTAALRDKRDRAAEMFRKGVRLTVKGIVQRYPGPPVRLPNGKHVNTYLLLREYSFAD